MIVSVFSVDWPSPESIPMPTVDHAVIRMVARGTPLERVCRWIIGQLPNEGYRSIWMLRLCAHGDAGFLGLGEGVTANTAYKFAALRDYMTPMFSGRCVGRGVQIHGCRVGSDDPDLQCTDGASYHHRGAGYDLLRTLAIYLNVPVRAGLPCQYGDGAFQYEGPSISVLPTGSIIEHPVTAQ